MITVTVTNRIEITGISGQVQATIEDRLTFKNPAYEEAEKRGFSTWNIPPEIKGYSLDGDVLTMPAALPGN